jgi:hypothetical protein
MNVRRRIWQISIEHPAQQIIRPFEKALTVVQTDDSRPKKQIMAALVDSGEQVGPFLFYFWLARAGD